MHVHAIPDALVILAYQRHLWTVWCHITYSESKIAAKRFWCRPLLMTFHVKFPNAAHVEAFQAIFCILVTASSALILVLVSNGHPKLNTGLRFLTRYYSSVLPSFSSIFTVFHIFWVQNSIYNYFRFQFWPEISTFRIHFPITSLRSSPIIRRLGGIKFQSLTVTYYYYYIRLTAFFRGQPA